MPGKIFLPIGDGTEIMDTMYPIFRLQEEGYEVVVAGPEARAYHGVMHEVPPDGSIPWDITREQPAYHVRATVAFRDVRPAEFVAAFFSGGRAPEYLRYDEHLLAITRHFFQAGKPVGMLCHGVEIPAAAGCLVGRTATTVPKCKLDITQFGGAYVDQPVVVDRNLVSSRGWHDNAHLFREFCRMLKLV
ncbi:MAG: peptidase [Planctomycetes bacterium]|nr:peptidase [Planctomycetota bacterium]